jgi:tetratricopeptide (TPR) repeat protein
VTTGGARHQPFPPGARLTGGGASLATILLAYCLVAGCSREPASTPAQSSPEETTIAGGAEALEAVVIPDFTSHAPAVRTQLETAAATFEARIARNDISREQRAAAYGEFGQLLLAAGFRATAAECLRNAERLAPDELRWPYYLGHIHRRDGRIPEAAAAFERAVRADATFMPAAVWLGNSYLDLGQPDEAERHFGKALSLQPDTVAAVFGLGRAALARSDYQAAVTHFERTLALDPAAGAVHQPLGLAYRALGRTKEAETHLSYREPAVEIRPTPDPLDVHVTVETAVGYQVRGQRALEAGDWPAAIALLQRAVELAPDDPALRHRYGTALALGGDQAAARAEFDTLTRRWPGYEKGQYSLGLMKADAGDITGALTAFRRAMDAAPTFLEARLQLAHLLRRTGNPAAAVPEYARILTVDPRVVEARFGRAMALVMLRRYADARSELEEGRTLHPEEIGFTLALARLLSAAPEADVRDGVRAASLVDGIPESQRRIEWGIVRAMALAEAGRFDEAARVQRAVVASLERGGSPELARTQAAVLKLYESRRPIRTMWQADEPMELPDSGIAARTP